MQDILQHINSVDGVIGSAVFSEKGEVLIHAFPALIDASALKMAANRALECIHGLQIAQTLDILDLRYAKGRIIIKAFPGALLCLLCSKTVNMQILSITLNLATKKLESLIPTEAVVIVPSFLPDTPAAAAKLRLAVSHLVNKEASNSFDSLGMVAVSQLTAKQINDFYSSPFKRLILSNTTRAMSGIFSVMVMNDMDPRFDGTIIIGQGIKKRLQVSEGDAVEVEIS